MEKHKYIVGLAIETDLPMTITNAPKLIEDSVENGGKMAGKWRDNSKKITRIRSNNDLRILRAT